MTRADSSVSRAIHTSLSAAVALLLLTSACDTGPFASRGRREVHHLVERLAERGIECENLTIKELDSEGRLLGGRPGEPMRLAHGYCEFDWVQGVDWVQGGGDLPYPITIIVYEGPEHIESLPDPLELAGQAIVYGEKWQMWFPSLGEARRVQEALDAEVHAWGTTQG